MTYRRTIPRDLFNEGDLLKCLGRLWVVLEQNPGHRAGISAGAGQPFQIEQDPSDGSISVVNLAFGVGGENIRLFRPLNSREPWPLWARFGDLQGDFEDEQVFDESGSMTPEFWVRVSQPELSRWRKEQEA